MKRDAVGEKGEGERNDRIRSLQGHFSLSFAYIITIQSSAFDCSFSDVSSPQQSQQSRRPVFPVLSLEMAFNPSLIICADPVATIQSWIQLLSGCSSLREGCIAWLSSLPACSNSRLQLASPPLAWRLLRLMAQLQMAPPHGPHTYLPSHHSPLLPLITWSH